MLADSPISAEELAALQAAGLGEVGAKLLRRMEHDRQEIDRRDVKLEKLSFEIAQLRRLKFGKKSEQLDAEQRALFDEALDADIAAAEAQLQELLGEKKPPATSGERPKRAALPANLPHVDRHHEPEDTTCACGCALKRIGTQHPSKVQANKALASKVQASKPSADVRAYAAKVTRPTSRLGLWEREVFELLALGVSYRQVQAFLAQRGTAVNVSAVHRFVHAKKRAGLLAQVQVHLQAQGQQGAAPAALAPSPRVRPPAASKAAPQKPLHKPPAAAAPARAIQAAAPVAAPAPGSLPKFTWDPSRYNIEDMKRAPQHHNMPRPYAPWPSGACAWSRPWPARASRVTSRARSSWPILRP